MTNFLSIQCTAFSGFTRIAFGEVAEVARQVKKALEQDANAGILIFDDTTANLIEIDFRGSLEDVLARLAKRRSQIPAAEPNEAEAATEPRGPGRPKLGVVAREVTVLPRHWGWLNSQPGGASVALRKLVEKARRENADKDRVRQAQEACLKFMSAMAGNLPNFEEATRALYQGNKLRFEAMTAGWPADIQAYAGRLSAAAFL